MARAAAAVKRIVAVRDRMNNLKEWQIKWTKSTSGLQCWKKAKDWQCRKRVGERILKERELKYDAQRTSDRRKDEESTSYGVS
jgi:hypothetical protein